MEQIKTGDKVILGNVSGEITEVASATFKIKFDTHQINGESEVSYPNTVINHLIEIVEHKVENE